VAENISTQPQLVMQSPFAFLMNPTVLLIIVGAVVGIIVVALIIRAVLVRRVGRIEPGNLKSMISSKEVDLIAIIDDLSDRMIHVVPMKRVGHVYMSMLADEDYTLVSVGSSVRSLYGKPCVYAFSFGKGLAHPADTENELVLSLAEESGIIDRKALERGEDPVKKLIIETASTEGAVLTGRLNISPKLKLAVAIPVGKLVEAKRRLNIEYGKSMMSTLLSTIETIKEEGARAELMRSQAVALRRQSLVYIGMAVGMILLIAVVALIIMRIF